MLLKIFLILKLILDKRMKSKQVEWADAALMLVCVSTYIHMLVTLSSTDSTISFN